MLRFSRDDIERLRRRCEPADGSFRPTANEAVCATLSLAICRLLGLPLPSTVSAPTTLALNMAVDMRPHVRGLPSSFVGNAFHIVSAAPISLGAPCGQPRAAALGEALAALRAATQRSRDNSSAMTAEWAKGLARLRAGLLPAADSSSGAVRLFTNYQAHLRMRDASFGAGPPIRVVPGPGDNVHCVPAFDGGVDVFLSLPELPTRPPDWVARAQSDAFRTELFDEAVAL